ncbi:PREDICTED: serine carboxypeptidase-like 11 isoform X1 [Ipomoea nil]|uniref:serine carboxypeptidase-like 11 isoform X1 n=1 Tax=Ipomoea nil TaxID=35883 RepID=UPI000901EC5E|nr:PREDICTED: serine carboxypeptidase-like 11 isoform X1 [Ipomoea nil]
MLLANLLRRRCSGSLPLLLGTVVVLWFCSSHHVAATGSKVEYLPGVRPEGPLPFELETGYIGVGELEDIQLFYYFVKSESNPSIDPIVLWITGGPGCSSFVAMTEEIGPLLFDLPKNNWTLPTLSLNPYSWTKVASFIYLDYPVGAGFSYAKSSKNYTANDVEASYHAAEFIRKWLEDHFQYQSNSFYVGGDSYSGITVPMVVQAISYGIDARFKSHVNLKGYVIGNGVTTQHDNYSDIFRTARGFSLISDEQYMRTKDCTGDCINRLRLLNTGPHFYWPNVIGEENDAKRFRGYNIHAFDRHLIFKAAVIASHWMNHDDNVLEALHVRKGCGEKWAKCRIPLRYERTVKDTRAYHANLSTKGYRSLIYSGNADLYVNSFYAETWTKSLNYSVINDWRPWRMNNRIVGYTRTFSNNMTYAKILGSDHIAPTITPAECFIMFKRWISHEQL